MMLDMFVEQAKVDDQLFIQEGVTNEELNEAITNFVKEGN